MSRRSELVGSMPWEMAAAAEVLGEGVRYFFLHLMERVIFFTLTDRLGIFGWISHYYFFFLLLLLHF